MVTRKSITVAVLVALCATGALAQDYIFTNFAASKDYPAPPSPCEMRGSAQPVVYDTSLWLFYTCEDNSVVARRFFHPNDGVLPAPPRTIQVEMPLSSCPGGFVAGQFGGCVPPDHPLAKK